MYANLLADWTLARLAGLKLAHRQALSRWWSSAVGYVKGLRNYGMLNLNMAVQMYKGWFGVFSCAEIEIDRVSKQYNKAFGCNIKIFVCS